MDSSGADDTRTRCPKRVWLVYASQTGKSEKLSYEIRDELWKIGVVGYPTSIELFEHVFFDYFESNKKPSGEFPLTVFVLSTTGQGDVPDSMISFWNHFLLNNMNIELLRGFNFTIFGLGDRCFGNSRFNLTARKLRYSLLSLGATEKVSWGLGDESHDFGILGEFDPWISNLKAALIDDSYLDSEAMTVFRGKSPPYKYICIISEGESLNEKDELRNAIQDQKNHVENLRMNKISGVTARISRITCNTELEREFKGKCMKLVRMRTLCKNEDEDAGYRSGSYVSIWPTNPVQNVVEFSKLINSDFNLRSVISIRENPEYYRCFCNKEESCIYQNMFDYSNTHVLINNKYEKCFVNNELGGISSFPLDTKMTIYTLIYRYLDIMNVPDRRFMNLCYKNTNNELHKKKLFEMVQTDSDSKKEYFEYVMDERRNYMEVLWDFNSVKLSLNDVINTIPIILPRQYSICNSPNWYNENVWRRIYLKHIVNNIENKVVPELFSSSIPLLLKNKHEDYKIFNKIRRKAIEHFLDKTVVDSKNRKKSSVIEVCVGVIEWNTTLNRKIRGLCSNFLDIEKPFNGSDILISFSSRMNVQTLSDIANPNVPILLLSCGLGITGIISILQERIMNNLLNKNNSKMNCLVCLGMRYSNVSYPFLDQIYDFSTNGELTDYIQINISYSRTNPSIKESIFSDKKKCVNINIIESGCYIQTLLLNDSRNHDFLVNCLLSGYVVVCGNALTMPIEIRETLSKILVSRKKFERTEDSMLYIRKLIRYGRYIEETWK
ncbi:hypothetical protein FG386_001288 [Cryptosporidium ryanae]|uniref:uncharacterized protein n=1 Tax=Cryptosporidium ryanae TaxID=515981 RepID=UPI00351AA4AD|nr:hypothetical protein FG386_001288 [Cryptosporidium ryanae]